MRPGAEAQLGTSLDPFLKTWLQAPRPRPCMTFDPATPLVGTSGRAQRSALRGPRCEASSKPPAEGTASALQPPGLSVALAAGLSHAVAPSRAACPAFQEVEDVCLPRMECALLVWWLQRHVLETAGGSPRSRLEGKVRKEAGSQDLPWPGEHRHEGPPCPANTAITPSSPAQLTPGAMNSERPPTGNALVGRQGN